MKLEFWLKDHNHQVPLANGLVVPTYPVYRDACPKGCDTVTPQVIVVKVRTK